MNLDKLGRHKRFENRSVSVGRSTGVVKLCPLVSALDKKYHPLILQCVTVVKLCAINGRTEDFPYKIL